jgi:hypothetical protein
LYFANASSYAILKQKNPSPARMKYCMAAGV